MRVASLGASTANLETLYNPPDNLVYLVASAHVPRSKSLKIETADLKGSWLTRTQQVRSSSTFAEPRPLKSRTD